MNDYITLGLRDGLYKKYRTVAKWQPAIEVPASERVTLLGELDATYGEGVKMTWEGEIIAYNSPVTGFGTPDDLVELLTSKNELFFEDHFGNKCYVRPFGKIEPRYFHNVWDAPSNKAFVNIRLVKSGEYVE